MWKTDLSSFLRHLLKEPLMASDKSSADMTLHRNVHPWAFHHNPTILGQIHTHQLLPPVNTASFVLPSPFLPLPSSPAAGPGFSSKFSHYQCLVTSLPGGVLDIFHKGTNTFKSIHPQSCQRIQHKGTSLSQLWTVLSSPTVFRLCDTACDSSFLNYSSWQTFFKSFFCVRIHQWCAVVNISVY